MDEEKSSAEEMVRKVEKMSLSRRKLLKVAACGTAVVGASAVGVGVSPGAVGKGSSLVYAQTPPGGDGSTPQQQHHRVTPAERKAAADRAAAVRQAAGGPQIAPNATFVPRGMPDYFGTIPNYANSPLPVSVSIQGGDGTGAAATASTTGAVGPVTITNGGTGYTSTPNVGFSGGGGSGATAIATVSGGAVTGVTITNPGAGYSSAPNVIFSGGGGSGAAATASKTEIVRAITVTNRGSDYTSPPTVLILGGGGSGATATATISGGAVTAIAVTNGGSGYNIPGLRKFVDSLPGLGAASANDLGQYIPVAIPDTARYASTDSDYYEIELGEYTVQMHRDLPPTKIRGYRQTNTTNPQASVFSYMGPVIIAQKDRPVRIKFTNSLPTGSGGNLFIPVDTTLMGAGTGPNGGTENYTENRASTHLHGGVTPWISDGTPHQWITPAGESTSYPKGVSVYNVPDMPDPGAGSQTLFYSNQQSARLMFYHDHAVGITRLNVYAGMAAGYIVRDETEQILINGGTIKGIPVPPGTIPVDEIPLIIQDRTFVPSDSQLAAQDPTWDKASWGGRGNLWFPHVYMPNQNPTDALGVNPMGRWDYGPWFWPPFTGLVNGPVPNPLAGTTPEEGPVNPGTPNPTIVPEGFMDTPIVNGTAYPYLQVGRKAYRFRILNACNDRFLNLQLYFAKSNKSMWNANGTLNDPNAGEVNMVPALPNTGLPSSWPTDARDGGVPDPSKVGPSMIQIGNEGGFLPAPAVLPNTPVGYNYNRRDITVLNVSNTTLFLGPAERADVIVDFSGVPNGSRIILYNDAPAPVPAFDPRNDYYTSNPDQMPVGGAPSTLPGYGPNTRTIMQFQVTSSLGTAPTFNLGALEAALPAAFAVSQDKPIVPQSAYNAAYNANYSDTYAAIQDTSLTFMSDLGDKPAATQVTMPLQPKAIQELFEPNYGRMDAILGVELPNTNMITQTTIPYWYQDPPTEIVKSSDPMAPLGTAADGTQLWKITHNGVDTHAIHVHLFNAQLVNRVGWDGQKKPPDANELGWKETIRMNPLEDVIVALRPIVPALPFKLPNSNRPMQPAAAIGSPVGFTNVDTNGLPVTVTNQMVNFGWEYVWHCHLLGHEENDMMRAIAIAVAPEAPSNLTGNVLNGPLRMVLNWTNNALNATGFKVQRATNTAFTANLTTFDTGMATTYTDTTIAPSTNYSYRVIAVNVVGSNVAGYPTVTAESRPSDPYPPVPAQAGLKAFLPIMLDSAYGGWNSGINLRNTASAPAHVNIAYYNNIGRWVWTDRASVPANGSVGFYQGGKVGIPWAGSAVLLSDEPIAVEVNQLAGGNNGMGYTGVGSAATTTYLPVVMDNAYGGWNTGINVQNTSSNPAVVTIRYYHADGTQARAESHTILPNAYWAVFQGGQFGGGWAGSAVVTSNQPVVAVVNEVHSSGSAISYNGFAAGGNLVNLPAVLNNAYGGWTTGVGIQNTTASATTGTIKYYNATGTQAGQQSFNIPGRGYAGVYQGTAGLPDGWAGSAVISASAPVVAVVNEVPISGDSMGYTGVITGQTEVNVPLVMDNSYGGWNTGLGIQNTTNSGVGVTVRYYDAAGAPIGAPIVQTIPAQGYWGLYQGGGLLGGKAGSAKIVATGPIAVIVNEIGPGGSAGSYNGTL